MRIAWIVLCLLAAASPAAASPSPSPYYGPPPGAEPPPAATPPPAAAPPAAPWLGPPSEPAPDPAAPASASPPRDEKSALVAFSLSFSMPIAALLAGVYLLDPDEGLGAATVIVAAVAGPATGWLYAGRPMHALATTATRLAGGLLFVRVFDDSAGSGSDEAAVMFGGLMFVAATLVDWIGPPIAVANDNAQVRARATVVPTAQAGGIGLSLVGSF